MPRFMFILLKYYMMFVCICDPVVFSPRETGCTPHSQRSIIQKMSNTVKWLGSLWEYEHMESKDGKLQTK